jgi:hypothetical protein
LLPLWFWSVSIRAYKVILIESAFVVVAPILSVNLTVKLKRPSLVGVPEITPVAALRESPRGKAPADIDQVYGAQPPVTASVCEYARNIRPFGNEVVVIVGAILMVMVKAFVAMPPTLSATMTVKL